MTIDTLLDSSPCLSLGPAKPRNMNIRSSKLRFRVTFVTFAGLPRERAGRAEYLSGKKAFRCEPCVNFEQGLA